jgi:formylglycine-generating enzyme required for sulfatase activity
LEFVLDGGYQTREYWSQEGWDWVQFKQAKHPLFWVCPLNCKSGCGGEISTYSHCQEKFMDSEQMEFYKKIENNDNFLRNDDIDENGNQSKSSMFPYKLRLMFDIVEMPINWPVEVNYHEAKAYCKWKGEDYRVLTEAEHHAIRDNEVCFYDYFNA